MVVISLPPVPEGLCYTPAHSYLGNRRCVLASPRRSSFAVNSKGRVFLVQQSLTKQADSKSHEGTRIVTCQPGEDAKWTEFKVIRTEGICSIAIDSNDNLVVIDSGAALVHRITPDGTSAVLAGTEGETGETSQDLSGAGHANLAVKFDKLLQVVTAANGTIFVQEQSDSKERIRMIVPDVTTLPSTFLEDMSRLLAPEVRW